MLSRVQAAGAEINRGEYREYDEETIRELARVAHKRGLKKLAAGVARPAPVNETPGRPKR